eukprot:TRINITY_DN4395_c0_g1_i2.p2 TRINITY_DN4395_c0_g1~~TRINITY_DN4395_c0_g1_i2.p2  ORF type:complete len:347 (-),score=45.53 TRINITY_DN4395_c0_g1_i2:505-1473(-)
MAKVKRTYHEAVIQKLLPHSMQGQQFMPSSNARNEAMLMEAAQFAKWLTTVEKDIQTMQKSIHKYIDNTEQFMLSYLPRVYEETPSGQVVPTEAEPQLVGQGVKTDQLALVPDDIKSKLSSDVLQPLRNWLAGFHNIKRRMNKVEDLRLEVDSRRRTAATMGRQLTRTRTRQQSAPQPPSAVSEQKLQRQDDRVKHKTAKANSAYAQYKELEADTFNQLSDLIKDTVYLKQYMAEAMLVLADGFNAAHQTFSGRVPLKENRLPTQVSEPLNPFAEPQRSQKRPNSTQLKSGTDNNVVTYLNNNEVDNWSGRNTQGRARAVVY